MHNDFGFKLSSEQCEILLILEETASVQKVSEFLRRDISSVNRQLQRIAGMGDLLEKIQGRWQVSKTGREIAEWTRDSIQCQRRILSARSQIRIVTRREFATRVIAPRLGDWTASGEGTQIVLLSAEEGVESWLLSGRADLGLDCGIPNDPLIRHRGIQEEPFMVVASPAFLSRHLLLKPSKRQAGRALMNTPSEGVSIKERLIATPHLEYTRAHTRAILKLESDIPDIFASFNDIAALRAACLAGLGWAVLPSYTVKNEIRSHELLKVDVNVDLLKEKFGVWWMRDRRALNPWIERLSVWLKAQDLGA